MIAEYNVSVCEGSVRVGREGGVHFAVTGIMRILIASACQIAR